MAESQSPVKVEKLRVEKKGPWYKASRRRRRSATEYWKKTSRTNQAFVDQTDNVITHWPTKPSSEN